MLLDFVVASAAQQWTPEAYMFAALAAVAIFTGFVDAIAGGGGLVMMPALLATGMPPHFAFGTNKLQSVFGTTMSCANYTRGGLVDWKGNWPLAVLVFVASASGALVVQQVSTRILAYIIPVILLMMVAYLIFSPRMNDEDAHERLSRVGYTPVAGGIGFYDGFFGPGTGQFFTTSLVALRGNGLIRAVGNTKLLNATTNWAAVLVFALSGKMIWLLGLSMAAGAMLGGYLGSRFAMKHGARVVRPLMIVASLGLTGKLVWDWFVS